MIRPASGAGVLTAELAPPDIRRSRAGSLAHKLVAPAKRANVWEPSCRVSARRVRTFTHACSRRRHGAFSARYQNERVPRPDRHAVCGAVSEGAHPLSGADSGPVVLHDPPLVRVFICRQSRLGR
jgi:hypothetical protein